MADHCDDLLKLNEHYSDIFTSSQLLFKKQQSIKKKEKHPKQPFSPHEKEFVPLTFNTKKIYHHKGSFTRPKAMATLKFP